MRTQALESERSTHPVLTVAHRGASSLHPENTLPAFEAAIEQRADAIEADVRVSADGHALVLHDATVDRTTSGRGRLGRLTLADARLLDAGAGAAIPTVAEVLDLARGRVRVLLEVKDQRAVPPTLDAVAEARMQDDVALMAFSSRALREARVRAPWIRRVRLSASRAEVAVLLRREGDLALGPWHRIVDADLVRRAHGRGRAVVAWTADEGSDLERLLGIGVDAIVTNRPDRLSALKGARGLEP